MNEMIEARVYDGEMWVRARDHSRSVGDAFEAGKAVGAAVERERIKAANAPEIERCNAYIKALEDAMPAPMLAEIRARGQA